MNKNRWASGTAVVNGKSYEALINGDSFAIRSPFLRMEDKKQIIDNLIEFSPDGQHKPTYYIYLKEYKENCDGYEVFFLLLLYEKFNVEEDCFEIESKGFINCVNPPFKRDQNVLKQINERFKGVCLETKAIINQKEYRCIFENRFIPSNKNNLCPGVFTTAMKLIPTDEKFVENMRDIFFFSKRLLSFVTLNTYPVFDSFRIYNTCGGYSDIEVFDNNDDPKYANGRFLYLKPFGSDLSKLLNLFPNLVERQYNLFHYNQEFVYEFDIVRISGLFERVFEESVKEDPIYQKELKERQNSIGHNELKEIFKQHSKKYKLGNNEDFTFCKKLFDGYGGTLKNKLKFSLDVFCKTMGYQIKETAFLYTPSQFEKRLKDARNAVCHGLPGGKVNWRGVAEDTYVLQELIYFLLLKYKARFNEGQIKESLDESFGGLNFNLQFDKIGQPKNA